MRVRRASPKSRLSLRVSFLISFRIRAGLDSSSSRLAMVLSRSLCSFSKRSRSKAARRRSCISRMAWAWIWVKSSSSIRLVRAASAVSELRMMVMT